MASEGLERIPPHNEEAEKSVLGAVLLDKDAFVAYYNSVKGTGIKESAVLTELLKRGISDRLVTENKLCSSFS